MATNKTTIKMWLAINHDGFVGMYLDKPRRDNKSKKWKSKNPFINSVLYKQMLDVVKQAELTWESDPEYFEITFAE